MPQDSLKDSKAVDWLERADNKKSCTDFTFKNFEFPERNVNPLFLNRLYNWWQKYRFWRQFEGSQDKQRAACVQTVCKIRRNIFRTPKNFLLVFETLLLLFGCARQDLACES